MRSPSASRSYLEARSANVIVQVACRGARLRHTRALLGRRQGVGQECPCSD